MSHFLKKHGGYSITEQNNMTPFEWEIYYYMTAADFRKEHKT